MGLSIPPADGWEILPCGCRIATAADTFLIEPCSLRCENYLYAVALTREQGKPVTHIDAS